jgi:hypothetical protein
MRMKLYDGGLLGVSEGLGASSTAIAFTLRLPASREFPALKSQAMKSAFCRDDFSSIYSNSFAMATIDLSGVDRLQLPLGPAIFQAASYFTTQCDLVWQIKERE